MLRAWFMRPNTSKIDWWMIALLLVSLASLAGATALWMQSVAAT